MDDTSVKWAINKTFVFHLILITLGEVAVHKRQGYNNFKQFHQNWMKNKKVLLIARLTDTSSVKVPLRSC